MRCCKKISKMMYKCSLNINISTLSMETFSTVVNVITITMYSGRAHYIITRLYRGLFKILTVKSYLLLGRNLEYAIHSNCRNEHIILGIIWRELNDLAHSVHGPVYNHSVWFCSSYSSVFNASISVFKVLCSAYNGPNWFYSAGV